MYFEILPSESFKLLGRESITARDVSRIPANVSNGELCNNSPFLGYLSFMNYIHFGNDG